MEAVDCFVTGLVIGLVFGFILGLLTGLEAFTHKQKRAEEEKETIPEPELIIPKEIPEYTTLSFAENKTLLSAYGQEIEMLGIGPFGITIKCHVTSNDDDERRRIWPDNPNPDGGLSAWTVRWIEVIRLFPKYKDEILAIANPVYQEELKAEEEFKQLYEHR